MNQKFTNVKAAAGLAVIWTVFIQGILWALGTIHAEPGWMPFAIMVTVFGVTLAGLNWLTSESR